MPTIRNDALELTVADDGAAVALFNRRTGVKWVLDSGTALADASGAHLVPFGPDRKPFGENRVDPQAAPAVPFTGGRVEVLGEGALVVIREGPAGRLTVRWELAAEGLRITALSGRSTVTACTLPGAFRPEGVDSLPVALPKNQGVWHRGTGGAFSFNMLRNGHTGWSMPFFAAVGEREALLTVIEDQHDARVWMQRTGDGRMRVSAIMDPSRGRLGYDRSVLLGFVDPDLTSICGGYRRYVADRGRLRTWDEKIAEKPNLERLFGALMCFVGYCQDESLDYRASIRRLREMGFERSLVYPLAIGNPAGDFQMGGRPRIDIRDQLGLIEELGYLAAGWMWVEEIPEDPDDSLLDPAGAGMLGWQIGERKWYKACPRRQVAIAERIQDEMMAGFSAQHFDVTASRAGLECFHPDHPLDRRGDAEWRVKVLETAARRGCVVSSEGFWDHAAASYDIGSAKLPVPVHEDWYAVPMTALVYHDSMVHDWWEVHNYNNPNHRNQFGGASVRFPQGGGWQELQAAVDALGGWPPNVMPFGSQYKYVNDGIGTREVEVYRYDLDMPEVRKALELALPVARLHRRVGKSVCVKHEVLAADGSLQATEFSDGTRVVANFSDRETQAPGAGRLPARSWRAAD